MNKKDRADLLAFGQDRARLVDEDRGRRILYENPEAIVTGAQPRQQPYTCWMRHSRSPRHRSYWTAVTFSASLERAKNQAHELLRRAV